MSREHPAAGPLLIGSIALAWGANWPIVKIALSVFPVMTMRAGAVTIAGAGLFLLAAVQGQRLRFTRAEFWPLIAASLGNVTLWYSFSALGVAHMGAARAAIIAFTMPLWVMVIEFISGKQKIGSWEIAGLLLGLAGLFCMIGPDWQTMLRDPWGPIDLTLGAVAWAAGTVIVKRYRFTLPTLSLTAWQQSLGVLPILAVALLFDPPLSRPNITWQASLALLYSAIVSAIYGNWAWLRVIRIYSAVVASISTLAVPVVGVITSLWLVGEPIGWPEIGSLSLILASLTTVHILPRLRPGRSTLSDAS
ncbi:MAG TPA: DMT family transporter [Dongiaceae bacterium]|nr:DMT family transporter [Dongiaceae bacterium]